MKPSDTKILDALKTQTAEADKRTAQHKLRLAEEREKRKNGEPHTHSKLIYTYCYLKHTNL